MAAHAAADVLLDANIVKVRRHLELVLLERRLHVLPVGRRLNHLPVVLRSDAHRHRERRLVGLPAVRDHALGLVELQLQHGDRGVAQVLVEDRRQVLAGLAVEVLDDVLGHDVLVLEAIVQASQDRPPALVVVDHAAQRVQEQGPLEILVLRRRGVLAAVADDRPPCSAPSTCSRSCTSGRRRGRT